MNWIFTAFRTIYLSSIICCNWKSFTDVIFRPRLSANYPDVNYVAQEHIWQAVTAIRIQYFFFHWLVEILNNEWINLFLFIMALCWKSILCHPWLSCTEAWQRLAALKMTRRCSLSLYLAKLGNIVAVTALSFPPWLTWETTVSKFTALEQR